MAKALYDEVGGVARKVTKKYAGVAGIARKTTKCYDGVGGVARQYFGSGMPAAELAVGSSVYMNVGGVSKEFIVVHKGNPSTSLYDASCDGVWLLMKDIYAMASWSEGRNKYADSGIQEYLNGTILGLFDDAVQAALKQVKIPYHHGFGSGSTATGANGLSTRVFLLSCYEVGWTRSTNNVMPMNDGACLGYFKGISDDKRVAYYNGTAKTWWLRSPATSDDYSAWAVVSDGTHSAYNCAANYGIRPAFILDNSAMINPETYEIIT